MKYFSLLVIIGLSCLELTGQTPDKDLNWEYTSYSDEFESGPLDESKWLWVLWWFPDNPLVSYPRKENIVFHHDQGLNEGIVTLTGKRESYYGYYKTVIDDDGNKRDLSQWYPTTCGVLTTNGRHNGYNHKYGYFEMKFRLQDNINWRAWDDGMVRDLGGTGGLNRAFWVFNADSSKNVAHAEIDFTEVMLNDVKHHAHGSNAHTIPHNQNFEGGHFALHKTDGLDPNNNSGHYKFGNAYDHNNELTFNGGWHIIGCEWLPNQVNWYLDGKLFIKLPADYIWQAPSVSYSPVEFLQKIPLYLIIGGGFIGADLSIPSPDLEYDIAYSRIYKMRSTSTSCQTDFNQPNYNFCTQYLLPQHTVYKSAVFGQDGCTTCSATFSTNCRVSVRAKDHIRLEDGFNTGEAGEFFANDVDCSKY